MNDREELRGAGDYLMNNGTERKSMDDVLASIRRIVRAEKEPEPGERPAGTEQPAGRADQPLALTPDMRMDTGSVEPEAISRPANGARFTSPDPAGSVSGAAGAGPAGAALRPAAADAGGMTDPRAPGGGEHAPATAGGSAAGQGRGAPAAGGGEAVPDEQTLRRLIREVLVEELTSGGAENVVRDIIRDELTNGEIGANISQNVIRLIQSEVERALEDR